MVEIRGSRWTPQEPEHLSAHRDLRLGGDPDPEPDNY